MEHLHELERVMRAAQNALDSALLAQYPKGTEVGVMLNCKQTLPSWGTVLGTGMHGHLRVRLVKPNKWGRHHVCDVHFKRVVC